MLLQHIPTHIISIRAEYNTDSNLPHDSRKAVQIGVVFTVTIVTWMIVSLRLYTRKFVTKTFGADDWLMLLLQSVLTPAATAIIIIQIPWGLGKHIWDIDPSNIPKFYAAVYGITVLYPMLLGTVKLSILTSYLRIFGSIRNMRIVTICSIVFISAMTIAVTLTSALQCIPVRQQWTPDHIPGSSCIDSIKFYWVTAALNISTDFWILILPMKTLWKMSLPKSQKLTTMGLFSLGGVACIVSIVRTKYVGDQLEATKNTDPIYDASTVSILSALEGGLASSTASIPPLMALIRKYFPHFMSSRPNTSTKSSVDAEGNQLRVANDMASSKA